MLPLENVRILDLTHVPPGQFCAMMLGDMGAEVLRVEQPPKSSGPGGGDATISNFIADYAGASLHAVIGILLALIARDKTGKGQHVDIAYTDGVVSLITQFASAYFNTGDAAAVKSQQQMMFSNAGYGVYKTRDGKYISLGVVLSPGSGKTFARSLAGRTSFLNLPGGTSMRKSATALLRPSLPRPGRSGLTCSRG